MGFHKSGFHKSGFINRVSIINNWRGNSTPLRGAFLTGNLVHPMPVELTGCYWLLRRDLNPPLPTIPGEHPCFTPTSKRAG